MENFKARTIENVSELKQQLVSQFDKLTKEDGIDYNISVCTNNGVSFYITFFCDINDDYRVRMRLSDHVCGRRGMDYVNSYEEALRLLCVNDAIEVKEEKIYEERIIGLHQVKEDDRNLRFHEKWTTKRGKEIEDYKVDRWTGRVRHITTRKNKGTLIVPEGLSNNYSMI